jgi:hypothetical protein
MGTAILIAQFVFMLLIVIGVARAINTRFPPEGP